MSADGAASFVMIALMVGTATPHNGASNDAAINQRGRTGSGPLWGGMLLVASAATLPAEKSRFRPR